MADLVLSPLVDTVIERLVLAVIDEVRMIWQVDDDLDTLSNTLKKIQCVLADAEEMQITKRAVKKWLGELKGVAYDADDVLDELAYEALRRVADGGHEPSKSKRKQVCSFFTSCSRFRSNPVSIRRDMAHRIKEINEKVARLSREREIFGLREDDGRRVIKHMEQLPLTSSLMTVPEQEVVGREEDVKRIIDLVVPSEDVDVSHVGKDVSVISIIGMGGLGKTTLARLIYNHEKVEKHFQVRAWVCVSEDFDISRVTEEIIESATKDKCDSLAIDPLQRKLQEILSARRFLIVLDDVWNEERNDWVRLRAPFLFGAKGSVIIVTARAEAVSRAVDTDHDYHLDHLAHDDCLSLFLRRAFKGENYDAHPVLKQVGKELVEKRCQGLPLAAEALGGLLSCNRDVDFWKSILKSHLWSSMENETLIMKALRVSYHHFPPHIKQCFAYCSIYPKDYEFQKQELIKLWMAQGFILPKQGMILEATGGEYFDFLLSRSFIHIHWLNNFTQVLSFKMHDCIHDLAMSISNDECLRMEHDKPTYIPDKGHRHSSFIVDNDAETLNLEVIYKCKGLRTFISFQNYTKKVNLDNQVLSDLIVNFRCLRVLSLTESRLRELPDSISNLKHLRYLDLSCGIIEQLPESLSSLYNLQTLNLSFCEELCQLPEETRKLRNLRHLNLVRCDSLKSMPPEMGKLTHLQTLSRFVVGRESGYKIGELKQLTEIKGEIAIVKLQNVAKVKEVEEINLKNRPHIDSLEFQWDDEETANMNPQDPASFGEDELGKILEVLQPHTNIKKLSIMGYRGDNYPSWLQNMMLPNLVNLSLIGCANYNSLPPLGQFCMLKHLHISVMNGVKCIGQEFYGNREIKGFPLLASLGITYMPNLEEWCEFEEGEFPCLQYLIIDRCPKLMKMPDYFSTLERLHLHFCSQLARLPELPSLSYLELKNCNEILLQWVPHLTSLFYLKIKCYEVLTSLPLGILQSLDNLKLLKISWCPKLVSLLEEDGLKDKGLPNLTSLHIKGCENLKALPKGLRNLISLNELIIEDCPQLFFLPEEGLPSTLQYLRIDKCEKLRERCRKEDGLDWAKILHINRVEIDGNIISSQ